MRKILLTLHTGYCGMEAHEAWEIPETVSDDELDTWAWECAVEHAGRYGIYPESDEDDEDLEDSRYSGHNIEGSWRIFEDKDTDKVTYGANDGPSWNTW